MDGHGGGTGSRSGRAGYSGGVCPQRLRDVPPKEKGCQPVALLLCDCLGQVFKRNEVAHRPKAEPHMQWVQTPLQAHQRPWSCVGKNLGPNIVLAKHRGGRVQGKEMGYKQLPAAIAESLCEAGGELAL